MRVLILSIVLLLSSFGFSYSQSGIRDSLIRFPFFGISYGVYVPGGDLKDRFGVASILTTDIHFKTSKNIVYGISAGFIFGNNVETKGLFDGLNTSEGQIIGLDGLYADVRTFERGYHISATIGKIFTFNKPNPNSGIILTGGPGFLQHKIRIEPIGNTVAGLRGDYIKGYDHLTNGWQMREFIGFLSFGNRQLINFYGGFEFIQGFTANRRDYNFNEPDLKDQKRLDLMYGFKLGWVLPLYKKKPAQYYMF
ncbi:MAG: hypothetical protein IPP71_15405 [Bacteroidetes bacterium]|nr:hypothetical protein [Bacteroidota bacterium]